MRGRLLRGRYRLVEKIGAGGMGEVWRSQDEALGRELAVKIFRPPHNGEDEHGELLARFRQEARAAAALDSPHIVAVYDFDTDQDLPYLAMALVNGRSLEEVLRSEGRLPLDRALGWTEQICAALTAAHSMGVVHRDIKPGNVMVTEDGSVKVLDFGIATFLEGDESANKLTRTGQMPFGSVLYMAPEQFTQQPSDGRLDLYALGCVLYELLIGRPPYTGPAAGVMFNHCHDTPLRPSLARAELPPSVDRLILALMAKDPDDRPVDAEAAAARVREIRASLTAEDDPVPAEPVPQPAELAPSKPQPAELPAAEPAAADVADPEPRDTPPVVDLEPSRGAEPERGKQVEVADATGTWAERQSGQRSQELRRQGALAPELDRRTRRVKALKAVGLALIPLVVVVGLVLPDSGKSGQSDRSGRDSLSAAADRKGTRWITTSSAEKTDLLNKVLSANGRPGPDAVKVVTLKHEEMKGWINAEENYPGIIGHYGTGLTAAQGLSRPFPIVETAESGYDGGDDTFSTVASREVAAAKVLDHLVDEYDLKVLLHLGHEGGADRITEALSTESERTGVPLRLVAGATEEDTVDREEIRKRIRERSPQVAVVPGTDDKSPPRALDTMKAYGAKELREDGFNGLILSHETIDPENAVDVGVQESTSMPGGVLRVRQYADPLLGSDCQLSEELCDIIMQLQGGFGRLEDFDAALGIAAALEEVTDDMDIDDARKTFRRGLTEGSPGFLGPVIGDVDLTDSDASPPYESARPVWLDRSEMGRWKTYTEL